MCACASMGKALLMCLCIILPLLGGIIGLTPFSSEARAQGSGIIVEDAEYVSTNTTAYSADLADMAKNVTPRIIMEYGESISELNLYKSDDLNQITSMVSSRIIVEYVNSIMEYGLQGVTVPDIKPRIIVEYADLVFTNNLVRPPAPLTSPPLTNISLNGVLGLESWFTSNVEVNLLANVPVEKTEYSFDNITWIDYTAPFTITNEGYNNIHYKSIDKAGNVEETKIETVKIDKTLPSGSILINNGDIYTTSRFVTLTLNAMDETSGVSQMRFSNYERGDYAWTSWEPFSTLKNWTITFDWELALQTRNVTATVYVQYMDKAGLISTSSDTIILNVKIPTPVVLNTPSNITTSSAILTWSRNNDLDFLCYQIVWNVQQPLEPSIGLINDPHYFEEMAGTIIYNQSVVSYLLKDLYSSTTYYPIVRTFNKQGIYSDSNRVTITTHAPATIPIPPWSPTLTRFVVIVSISVVGTVVIHRLKKSLPSHTNVWRALVACIIFGLGFYSNEIPSELPWSWIGIFVLLGTPLLWSALGQSSVWGFIFGITLGVWGFIYGHFNPISAIYYLIGLTIYCGVCSGFGSLGGWVASSWGKGKKPTLPPTPIPTLPPTPTKPPTPVRKAPSTLQVPTVEWPDGSDYQDALQNPQYFLLDQELKKGVIETDLLALPKLISGRYGCVFRIQCGNTYAVKCYKLQKADLHERYKLISNYLAKPSLRSFVKFTYLPKAILVRGKPYPVLKMEWAEGERLDNFIEDNLHNKDLLRRLADKFIDSVIELQKNKIAHGDLHPENILVMIDPKNKSIKLRFVDYDCIYIPDFSGRNAPELGHINYQHPARRKDHFNEKLDNFSSLIIYLSLLAIAEDPDLWKRYYNGECMILTEKDFKEPQNSDVIRKLLRSQSEKVQNLAKLLQEALDDDPLSDKINPTRLKAI